MRRLSKLSLSVFGVGDVVKSLIINTEGIITSIILNDGDEFDNTIQIEWADGRVSELWHCYCDNIILLDN
jgi:hypothetical protein